jgi:hypothetical protein
MADKYIPVAYNVEFLKSMEGYTLMTDEETRIQALLQYLEMNHINYLWVSGTSKPGADKVLLGIYVPIVKTFYSLDVEKDTEGGVTTKNSYNHIILDLTTN